jgi:hypothetical protein
MAEASRDVVRRRARFCCEYCQLPEAHPRRMKWDRHFRWDGPFLLGRTAIGRVTIAVLNVNEEDRVDLRQALIDEGVFPTRD